MNNQLDRRSYACRPDLADIRLRDRVVADRYTDGMPAEVIVSVADLRPRPDAACGIDTQALCGEALTVFDISGGWAWVQLAADGYVGYVREEAIGQGVLEATHVVSVPRSFVYPGADLRFPPSQGPVDGQPAQDHRRCRNQGHGLCTARRWVCHHRRASQAIGRSCGGRRGLRGSPVPAHALSVGRAVRFRNRLLWPGADGAGHDRKARPARFRPAGGRSGPDHRP